MREYVLDRNTIAPYTEGGQTSGGRGATIRSLGAAATAAFLIGTFVSAILVHASLYADGANYLLQIIAKKGFLVVWWDRSGVNILTQAPLVLGLHVGIHSMQVAVLLYSLGILGVPTVIYLLAMALSRGEWYLPLISAVILAIYASTFFMSVSESTTAYAVYLLMAVILASSRRLNYVRATILIFCSLVLPFLYETSVIFGPLLALWSAYRFRSGHDPILTRRLLFVPIITGLAAAVLSAAAILHPIDSQAEQNAGSLSDMLTSHEFDAACVVIIGALAFAAAARRPLVIASGETVLIALATLFTAIGSAVPNSQYLIRLAPTGLLVLVFGVLWKPKLRNRIDLRVVATSQRIGYAVLVLVTALAIQNVALLSGWQNFLSSLQHEVNSTHGLVPYSEAELQLAGEYGWPWTFPTMSRIVQSSPRQALIENPDPLRWQPFDPSHGAPSAGGLYWRS